MSRPTASSKSSSTRSTSRSGGSTTATQRVVRRRWRRLPNSKREGWWPWGLLPLLVLLATFLAGFFYVAPSMIEEQISETTAKRLAAAGHPWAKVTANGQEVLVTGAPPTAVDSNVIHAMARATDCETAFGELNCPTDVRVKLDQAAAPKPTAAPKPVAAKTRFHDFVFNAEGKQITLTGEVPSADVKARLETEAKKHFENVTNNLVVSKEAATPGYDLAFPRALGVLKMIESGDASWKGGILSISGVVAKERDEKARASFAATEGAPKLGSIDLLLKEVIDTCDKDFAAILKETTILFATASAKIKPQSGIVLKALSEVAARCPGHLLIEGHTDSDGKPDENLKLSKKRADAVAAALTGLGVEAKRLEPRGFGQSKPIAPNDTPAGKQQNRRIEVHIDRHATHP